MRNWNLNPIADDGPYFKDMKLKEKKKDNVIEYSFQQNMWYSWIGSDDNMMIWNTSGVEEKANL